MVAKYGSCKIVCDRSAPGTIELIRQAGLNAVAHENKREDAIRELGGRFFVQGDGKPRIFVSSKCVNWIHEVMVYKIEIKENDHLMDSTMYALMASLHKSPPLGAFRLG
jgi:hypothetical protein